MSVAELNRQLVVQLLTGLAARMLITPDPAGRHGGDLRGDDGLRSVGTIEGKAHPWHRDRLAVVYVRQSTPQPVLDHAKSTRLQYGLTQRAVDLGWAPSRMLVIDEDPGHSAFSIETRPGSSGWSPR
ncbi:hypothetical protein [Streptomyces syringium]|uniref:hypothetical protein n=1 Tax=Streptomyces syringium TaxID=76729 RepID=UPI00345671FE